MELTTTSLASCLSCSPQVAAQWLPGLAKATAAIGVTTPVRMAAFLAQIGHESNGLTTLEENLNYSVAGLLGTFPKYFDAASAAKYARHPEQIANHVYANRGGNGSEQSGDGWVYRGRGPIQVTFKDNYAALSKYSGVDYITNPSLVSSPEHGPVSAAWFWTSNNLVTLSDSGDVLAVSRAVNLGNAHSRGIPNGMDDREARYKRCLSVLGG